MSNGKVSSRIIITTKELASFYKLIDYHLIKKYGTDFVGLLNLNVEENKTEILMMLIMQFEDVRELVENYNLYDFLYQSIDEFKQKKIWRLSNQDLGVTLQQVSNIKNLKSLLTGEQLEKVFRALESNMQLYERLYKDKVWIIDSSLGRKEKITISTKRFFHILGLEEKVIKSNMQEFESVFNESDNIKALLTDRQDLFAVLEKILSNEDRIINAVLDGKLNNTFNFPKIEMKNYSFERIGILEHSSGMIFYDKSLDCSDALKTSHLQSNLFLLNDFIRNYKLDFIFSAYRPYKFNKNSTMLNKDRNSKNNGLLVSDAESLFISGNGGENSRFLDGQLSSISESAGSYHPKSFDYTVTLEDGSEVPISDPDNYIEFSDEDRAKMAAIIIEELPNLDNSHLKTLYDDLTNGSSSKKK